MSAIPTGSFTPASPSRIVPLRPPISLSPRIENITAGSVGDSAAARTPESVQLKSSRKCAQIAIRTAVVSVPTIPSAPIGTIARRKRRQPMCMPPSKRITISATTPIRSTVSMCGIATGIARATSRNSAGAGIGYRSAILAATSASITPVATTRMISPKSPSSATRLTLTDSLHLPHSGHMEDGDTSPTDAQAAGPTRARSRPAGRGVLPAARVQRHALDPRGLAESSSSTRAEP